MSTYKFPLTFFTTAACFCTLSTQITRAAFLQGHLEQSNIMKTIIFPPKTMPLPIVPQYSTLALPMNSYPRIYEGCWQCRTVVTYSSIKTVEVGTKIACDITFFRTIDDKTWAHFNQSGWIEKNATVHSPSKIEARSERTDYYNCTDLEETWIARSQDHFILINPTSIKVDSLIEQTHNGWPVGNYHTISMLYKQTKQ